MSLPDIRQGICDLLASQVERSTSWFPYPITPTVTFPAGMIAWTPDLNIYGDTFDPEDTIYLDVELHVRAAMTDANMMMDEYLSRNSGSAIVDALNEDHTLNGLVTDVAATGFDVDVYDGPDSDFIARVHLKVML